MNAQPKTQTGIPSAAPRVIFFDDIHRLDDGATAFVRIVRCDWFGDNRKYTEVAAYETMSRGAKASARREIKRQREALADALAELGERFA